MSNNENPNHKPRSEQKLLSVRREFAKAGSSTGN
jgi:hypothetical protein